MTNTLETICRALYGKGFRELTPDEVRELKARLDEIAEKP